MMKRFLCLAVIFALAGRLIADDAATAKSEEASTNQASTATAKDNAVQEVPLHQHPTILKMLKRNNEIRARLGLRPHRINPALTQAAQDHARYMARTRDFSHYSNGGPQYRAGRFSFRGFVRENIAWNYRDVDQTFNAWQASGGHYASIVSDSTEAGFGYAVSSTGETYWVGVYGNGTKEDIQIATKQLEKEAAELAAKEYAAAQKAAAEEGDVKLAVAEETDGAKTVVKPASVEMPVTPMAAPMSKAPMGGM
nr:CAP domain-containing protein [Pirellula staleyi]